MTGRKFSRASIARDFGNNPNWSKVALILGLLLLAWQKFATIGGHEIVASDSPHDDFWQILSAASWYWGRPYDEWALMHLPVAPLFIAVTGTSGIPLRITIELTYLAGAAILSFSLDRLGLPRALQALSFALVVFHPYSFGAFDIAIDSTLYACLMLFFVALFIRIIVPTSPHELRMNAILFAGVTALLWYTRTESILIGGLLCLMAIAILAAFAYKAMTRADALRYGLVLVVGPLSAVIALGAVISAANGLRYGLWHTTELAAPNYLRAYASLQSIRPDHPIRFVPVTRAARQQAYAVSPAFRELQPILDGEQENWGEYFSRISMGIHGEIGGGWFYWTLIDAAAKAGHFKSARDAEAFFGRVADEITAALNDGRLPSRMVILPYIDPDFSLWLGYVPTSFVKLVRRLFPPGQAALANVPAALAAEVPADVIAAFDRIANRRAAASKPPSYLAQGWMLSSGPRPTAVQIVDVEGKPIQGLFQPGPRLDIPVLSDPSGRPGPQALGFMIDWPAKPLSLESVRFKLMLEGNKSAFSEPIAAIPVGHEVKLLSADADFSAYLAVDRLDHPTRSRSQVIGEFITGWYPTLLGIIAIICGIRLVLICAFGRCTFASQSVIVLLFMLAIIIERLLFFAVLDASAWTGDQVRYILPVATLAAVVPVVLLASGRTPARSIREIDRNAGTEREQQA